MWPVLWQVGDSALYSYLVAFNVAYFLALGVWFIELRRWEPEVSFSLLVGWSLGAVLWGLVGARGLYLVTQWRAVLSGELRVWALWEGGIVFYGGALAGGFFLWRVLRRAPLSSRHAWNSLAPALAWAHAVGRIGCFMNGCCHGEVCPYPWAVVYSNPLSAARPLGVPLHPTQLYEAGGLICLALFLHWNNRRTSPRFSSIFLYVVGYGVLRFCVEWTRGDDLRGQWGPFSTSQWIALLLIFSALLLDSLAAKDHNSRHESRN